MNKEDILKILEGAKDKNGDVPMRLVRQAFEKLPEPCTDTIIRQAAIDALQGVIKLTNLPSSQPEIVRCKNCVNWIPGHITEHDDFIPPKCGKYQQMVGHSSDDYCSFAVRRTDE